MNDRDDLAQTGPQDAAGRSAASFAVPDGPDLGLAPEVFQALGGQLLAALADYKRELPSSNGA